MLIAPKHNGFRPASSCYIPAHMECVLICCPAVKLAGSEENGPGKDENLGAGAAKCKLMSALGRGAAYSVGGRVPLNRNAMNLGPGDKITGEARSARISPVAPVSWLVRSALEAIRLYPPS